jgi:hypothetical protein
MSDNPTPRSAHLCGGIPGVLKLSAGPDTEAYFVTRAAEAGAYVLEKINADGTFGPPYTVSAAGCSCPGFARHHHCKHHAALLALRAAGRL